MLLHCSLKSRSFVQLFVLRYACVPKVTRSYPTTLSASFLFCFVSPFFYLSLEMSLFPSIFNNITILLLSLIISMERMSYVFPLPDVVFSTL